MSNNSSETSLTLYIVTFNCGLSSIEVDSFASQLFSGLSSPALPDLLVLSLQEIAPIPYGFIGESYLIPYFTRFYHAVQKAARKAAEGAGDAPIYHPISARNVGITGIMVFAKDPEAIKDIETAGVGVGLAEMGNKGAVSVRFTYQAIGSSTELTFVSAHLAAMEGELQRRNEDWKNIVRRLVFSSTKADRKESSMQEGEEQPLLSINPRDARLYKPTSHLFVAGDLNYRTSVLKPSPADHKSTFPQPHHDSSSPQHYTQLFENDQLSQEREAGRTLHGLVEAPVTFPPTYKYASKEPFLTPDSELSQWHWAPHRWPSWCDRILWLPSSPSTSPKPIKYSALPLQPTTDHRAVALEVSVPLRPVKFEGDGFEPPFEIDVDWKKRRDQARILELVAGYLMFSITTWEGRTVLAAIGIGAIGAFFAIKALLE